MERVAGCPAILRGNRRLVWLMSGYAGGALPRMDRNGYDVPFIEKPFTVAKLAKKVREVLAG